MTRATLSSGGSSVEFGSVLEERPDYVADITEYPIEGGYQISDHATLRPVTVSIDGIVTGDSAPGILASIRSWQENRLLVTYSGRGIYRDFVIKEFRPTEDVEVGDGFRFAMTIQEVRIVSPVTIDRVTADPAILVVNIESPAAQIASASSATVAAQVRGDTEKGRDQPQDSVMGIPTDLINSVDTLKSILNRRPV